MIAHGISHAAATFFGAVAAGIATEIIVNNSAVVTQFINGYLVTPGRYLGLALTNWQIIEISMLLFVGFVWGLVFKWIKGC